MAFLMFIIGFGLLVRGAEWLVDGSTLLGKKLGAPDLLIGLTIVAFGTSLPELVVNIFAGASGEGDLAMANAVGSNIANTLLILGVAATIRPLTVHRTVVYREIIFNIMATLMLAVLVADKLVLGHEGFIGLDKVDGIVLMSYFMLFLYYSFGRSSFRTKAQAYTKKLIVNIPTSFLKIVGGAMALYFGGSWIVSGASEIALSFGLSETLIGATVVAIGTSLPELASSVIATKRGQVDIAVGNAVGSNLFNILWVLGLGAFLNPIAISSDAYLNIIVATVVATILFGTMVFGKYRHQISQSEGRIFISIYIIYIIGLVIYSF
jgi:cation:H+ antiporter